MIEIGSSDAPVILGVSPHSTPWQLWAEQVGLIERKDEPDEVMRWGTRMEKEVLWGFYEEARVVAPGWRDGGTRLTQHHPARPWQRATPDDFTGEALVEVKCVVTQPPTAPRVDWLVQCLHQRLVYDQAERQYLVAFGALRMVWWEIPRHQKALDRVLREEERFLELVEKQIPPPVRAEDAGALSRAWAIVKPDAIRLGMDALACALVMEGAKVEIAKLEAQQKHAEAGLKALIGEHAEALLPDGSRYTWRPHQVKEHVVAARIQRPLKRKGNGEGR